MGKGESKNIIILQILQSGARAGGGLGHTELPLKAFQSHSWKLLLLPICTRLCQAHRLHQGTYHGGAGAERDNDDNTCVSEGQPAGGGLGRAVGVLLLQVVTVGAILT